MYNLVFTAFINTNSSYIGLDNCYGETLIINNGKLYKYKINFNIDTETEISNPNWITYARKYDDIPTFEFNYVSTNVYSIADIDDYNKYVNSFKTNTLVRFIFNESSTVINEYIGYINKVGSTLRVLIYLQESNDFTYNTIISGIIENNELRITILSNGDILTYLYNANSSGGVVLLDDETLIPSRFLPSYVDDVIDIASFVTKTELVNNIGEANYTNKSFIVNSPTSDSLYNKIVITNANTSQNDWQIIDPENGKIYINERNNHSYRWSGNSFVDLDKNFNDRITALENKAPICNLSGVTNRYDLSTATSGINTLYNALKKGDAAIGAIIKFTTTDNNIYYARIVYRNYVDTANEPINIIIENNECRQSYDITNIITLLYNDATLNFSSSNNASNLEECKKIIKNKTTAHIFYNNIVMQQVDLADTSSIKFIGYSLNGILNYYGCNINTGSIVSLNTYNISKTCLYKTYNGQLLTETEIKNVREQQRTLYFLTDSAEDRLTQITAYNLTNTTGKGYPCVFTINSLTYEGFCFVSSINEINFVTINKYTIYGWVINAKTGAISSKNTANLLEMFNLSSYKSLGGNKTNINNFYSEFINILWGNTINLTQSQITNIPSDIATKLPNANRINFILDDNNIMVFNRGYYKSPLYYFYCIFNDNTLHKLIYNSTNNDVELISVTIGNGGSESSDINIVTLKHLSGFDAKTDQKIQNAIGVIFNNYLFTRTNTNNGREVHFILLDESLEISELIYNIASKSFTASIR